MNKNALLTITKIIKWLTAALLVAPLGLFFAPYRLNISGFTLMRMASYDKGNDMGRIFFYVLLPIILSVIAGLIIVFYHIGTAITSLLICIFVRMIYSDGSGKRGFIDSGIQWGYKTTNILNIVCIVLCIVLIVLMVIQLASGRQKQQQ